MKKAVYAGSFDPFTNGHLDVLKQALKDFDEITILLAINPDKTYRYSLENRISSIKRMIQDEGLNNVSVASTDGLTVKFAKSINASYLIRGYRNESDLAYENKMKDINKKLDPTIETVFYKASDEYKDISSTLIREKLDKGEDVSSLVPKTINAMIN